MSEQAATIVSVALGIVIMAVVYIVPIWMALRVRKKGYSGWAWATGISALFGIGLIVGGIALIVARKEVGPETKCPQCGKLAHPVGAIMVNRETGEEVKTPILGVLALVCGIALNIFAGWMAVSLWLNPLPSNVNVNPCSTIGFAVMIGSSMAGWGVMRRPLCRALSSGRLGGPSLKDKRDTPISYEPCSLRDPTQTARHLY